MQASSRSTRRIVSLSAVLIAAGAAGMSNEAVASAPAPVPKSRAVVPPNVDVPLRVMQATLENGTLAVTLSCAHDGIVSARLSSQSFAKSRFDCADGTAIARVPIPKNQSARVGGGRLRINARAGSMTVTRTMRPRPAAARFAADITFNINGGISYDPLPCYGATRMRMTATGGWTQWFGTTGVCTWQKLAGDETLGTITQYSYLSVDGTWVLYRTLECPVGSAYCRWTYVRSGF